MTHLRRCWIGLLCLLPLALCAQTIAPPVIDKVDPPNWWTDLPSPMLLIKGEHLTGARFSLEAKNVRITRSQISKNGHWAFLWLDSSHAFPETIYVHARTSAGDAKHEIVLQRRRPGNSGSAGFSSKDMMYLIMPDRFADGDRANDVPAGLSGSFDRSKPRAYHGGDLRGIEQHLDYLQQLGVTTVWVTPLYDNSGDRTGSFYHGYSATDMYAVDPHLGTLSDYKHLADALHARGMKLVLDTVPNHVGAKHPWATDEPTPDWFHGTVANHIAPSGNLSPVVDPHGNQRDRIPLLDGWFANTLPDLNQENPLVATYLIQNAVWWIETAGVDGLRLDTFPYVGRHFWHDFHAELHSLYPHLTTLGEVWDESPAIVSYFAGGAAHADSPKNQPIDTGLDTPFDFPMYIALRAVLVHGEPMTRLAKTLREDSLYPHPERLVPFEGNHDTKRFLSESGATPAELKLAFGLLATLRGMPEIYSGDEVAMDGGDDPDNRRDFPGGFPGDPQNAFTPAGRTPEQATMHDYVAGLFQYRQKHPALTTGDQQDLFVDNTALAFVRSKGPERLLVVANNAGVPRTVDLNLKQTILAEASSVTGDWNAQTRLTVAHQSLRVTMPARSVAVYTAQIEP